MQQVQARDRAGNTGGGGATIADGIHGCPFIGAAMRTMPSSFGAPSSYSGARFNCWIRVP